MTWVEPVTDRPNSQTRTTATDMNRIAGNINYLLKTNIKANYTDTDIVTYTQWQRILQKTRLLDHYGLAINDSTKYDNLNAIETVAKYTADLQPLQLSFGLAKTLGGGRL